MNNKKKRLLSALVVGGLGLALVVFTRPMARGGFLVYVLGIVILVSGVVGLQYLEEILSNKKRDDPDRD